MQIDWGYVFWGGVIFVASSGITLVLAAVVVVALPSTYFLDRPERRLWVDHHPIIRVMMHLIKNLIGVCLVAAGLLLALPGIPGQGILIVVVGLLLLDFPGKHRWERRLVSQPRVLATINRIRTRFGKRPLQLSEES